MKHKILFIDRDGTLINEPLDNFRIDCIEKLSLEFYVIPALITLQKNGFTLIMITNQDGLGTADFPKFKFYGPHNFMMKLFISQGIIFEKVLICPHTLSDQCNCRKPKTTLITSWLQNDKLNKTNSYVIGDRQTDIMLAQNLKIQGILYQKDTFNWQNICNKLTK